MSNIERTADLGHDESGLAIIHKHAAHRLVQHTLQVVEVAWTDDSTLVIFFYMHYCYCLHHAVVRKGWSPVTSNTGTMSQATKKNGIATDCHAVMSIALATE